MAELSLSTEFLEWLIVKVRAFELEDMDDSEMSDVEEDAPGRGVSHNRRADPVYLELVEAIDDLNERQRHELVALVWTGRAIEEDEAPDSFDDLVSIAAAEGVNKTSAYLLGMPLLADYLEEGCSALEIELDT